MVILIAFLCRRRRGWGRGRDGVCRTGAVVVVAVSLTADRLGGGRERRGRGLVVLSCGGGRGGGRGCGYTACSWPITMPAMQKGSCQRLESKGTVRHPVRLERILTNGRRGARSRPMLLGLGQDPLRPEPSCV